MNIGEEICGEWLRHIRGCQFIEYNHKIPGSQGEIDVIGINTDKNEIYTCEVAVHLVSGLQYVNFKIKKVDNVQRLTAKFKKDIEYVKKVFPLYHHIFMLWSPIVKSAKASSKSNQTRDFNEIVKIIENEHKMDVQLVINEGFIDKINDLRRIAEKETKEFSSSVMRFLQVEEKLKKHINRMKSVSKSGT